MSRKSNVSAVSSHKPTKAKRNAKKPTKSRKNAYVFQFIIPRLDTYNVNHCLQCGVHIDELREEYQRVYDFYRLPVTIPSDVCVNCGLERREMAIHLQSKRKPTVKSSKFKGGL